MQQYNEQDVSQLTPQSDTPKRVTRQAIFAVLGALILSTPLWLSDWYTNPILAGVVGLSLLITPGLSIDMLVYSGMRRPSASLLGSTMMLSIAWYAGIISLLMTLGYGFDINRIAIITLILSSVAIIIGFIIGGHKTRELWSKDDLRYAGAFVSTVAVMSLVIGGASYVANNKNVLQPTGDIQMMSMDANDFFTKDNPYVAYDNVNALSLNVASSVESNTIRMTYVSEGGEVVTSSSVINASENPQAFRLNMPFITGCGVLTITNETTGQTINNLYVKQFSITECEPVAYVKIFEKFDIDMSGAPTGSLKELLRFAEEQLNKANMEDLPQEYKDCIKKENVEDVLACLDSVL